LFLLNNHFQSDTFDADVNTHTTGKDPNGSILDPLVGTTIRHPRQDNA